MDSKATLLAQAVQFMSGFIGLSARTLVRWRCSYFCILLQLDNAGSRGHENMTVRDRIRVVPSLYKVTWLH
jgi:hypothetical protein